MEIDKKALFMAWVGGLVRHLLTGIVGYFVMKGIITGEQGEMTILSIIGFVGMVVWSLIEKYFNQQTFAALRDKVK
jgi:predicted lipid-binding transport protein (Tim44 family)